MTDYIQLLDQGHNGISSEKSHAFFNHNFAARMIKYSNCTQTDNRKLQYSMPNANIYLKTRWNFKKK